MIELTFPWPPAALSPNARTHWAVKAKAAKKYKSDCLWICTIMNRAGKLHANKISQNLISITFNPPDNRRRDGDNLLSSVKQLIDAISDFTGIDDSKFTITFSKSTPVKHGAVKVVIA